MVTYIPRHLVEDVKPAILPFCGREVLAACGTYAATNEGALALLFLCAEFLWRSERLPC